MPFLARKFRPQLWGGLWGEIENATEMPMKSAPTGGLPLRHMGHCLAKAMGPTLESEQWFEGKRIARGHDGMTA